MAGVPFWTVERYSAALAAAHVCWLSDRDFGRLAGKPFSVVYLYRRGLRGSTTRFRKDGRFAEALARAPDAVRAGWKPPTVWDAASIQAALARFYASWRADAAAGRPAGRPWRQGYINHTREGRAFIRMILCSGLSFGGYLRRMGGDIAADWQPRAMRWDPDQARKELREAHAAWRADAVAGRLAGKPWNGAYLECAGYRKVYRRIDRHVRGGIHAFLRTIPGMAAEWQRRRPYRLSAIRAEALALYRVWYRDPYGRLGGRPFGPRYAERHRVKHVFDYVKYHGRARSLAGAAATALRLSWCRRFHRAEYATLHRPAPLRQS